MLNIHIESKLNNYKSSNLNWILLLSKTRVKVGKTTVSLDDKKYSFPQQVGCCQISIVFKGVIYKAGPLLTIPQPNYCNKFTSALDYQ